MKRRLTQRLGASLVLTMFGCCWGAYGAYVLGGSERPVILGVPMVLTMIMFVGLTRIQRRIDRLPNEPPDGGLERRDARGRQLFAGATLALGLAIVGALQAGKALGHPEYPPPAIALIMGAYFFVVAGPMQLPPYRVVGGLLALVGAGVLAVPAESQAAVLGVGCAAILWVAALQRFHEVRSTLATT
jgi:hypothetical protein